MDVNRIIKAIEKEIPGLKPQVSIDPRGIVTLKGDCETWEQVVDAGHIAADCEGVKNVVCKLTVKGAAPPQKDYSPYRESGLRAGVTDDVDVLIIGAGISGCGIARELSKYDLNILVVDAGEDVASGASKANNGNIHPGHAEKTGSLKVKLNVEGNKMYTKWSQDLGFDLQRSGILGFVTDSDLEPALHYGYEKALDNGVETAELVDRARALELEPTLKENGKGDKLTLALWLPTMGLVEPYRVCVALAENAAANGVKFRFNCTVADILRENGAAVGAVTGTGIIKAKYIINCAGVYADEISAMAGDECYTIHPRRGTIAILDQAAPPEYNSLCDELTAEIIERMLSKTTTKGGARCRTPDWNVLMGPSATEIPDKEDLSTTPEDLAYAMGRGEDKIKYSDIIRFFAGNRPANYKEDFVIELSPVTPRFINCGAIQSPGLAAAPAIAKMVEEILTEDAAKSGMTIKEKPNWNPIRKAPPEFRKLSHREQDELIRQNPAYGRVICRCETVTEGEILEVLRSPVVPGSIDAIKRRTRAGMGRCQGGFCQPRVLELLAREHGCDPTEITLKGEGTNILLKSNRPGGKEEKQ